MLRSTILEQKEKLKKNLFSAWIARRFPWLKFSWLPLVLFWRSYLACLLLQSSLSTSMTTEDTKSTWSTRKKQKTPCKTCRIHISWILTKRLWIQCFNKRLNNNQCWTKNHEAWNCLICFKITHWYFIVKNWLHHSKSVYYLL